MEDYKKYENPSQLIHDQHLDKNEKINHLQQWLEDEESLSRATDEGLVGQTRSDILKEVKKALLIMQDS